MTECFQTIDEDDKGTVNREDILKVYLNIVRNEESMKEIKTIVKNVEVNELKVVDYNDFIQNLVKKDKIAFKGLLNLSFSKFDIFINEKIFVKELKEILSIIKNSNENIQKLIETVNLKSENDIDFNEIKQMILHSFL